MQDGLDAVHARAYALVGGADPGADLRARRGMSAPLSLGAYRAGDRRRRAVRRRAAVAAAQQGQGRPGPARRAARLAGRRAPEGPLVWLHGASVGETVSLLPLVERLTQAGLHALVTSGTLTSARLMARRLPPRALHQFAPLDAPVFFRRFFAHWRPDLGLIAESEIWPNMIGEAARTPLAMVNARMSERSFRRWTAPAGLLARAAGKIRSRAGAEPRRRRAVLEARRARGARRSAT